MGTCSREAVTRERILPVSRPGIRSDGELSGAPSPAQLGAAAGRLATIALLGSTWQNSPCGLARRTARTVFASRRPPSEPLVVNEAQAPPGERDVEPDDTLPEMRSSPAHETSFTVTHRERVSRLGVKAGRGCSGYSVPSSGRHRRSARATGRGPRPAAPAPVPTGRGAGP